MSHEVMIRRSAAEGQEVNSRNADVIFTEDEHSLACQLVGFRPIVE